MWPHDLPRCGRQGCMSMVGHDVSSTFHVKSPDRHRALRVFLHLWA